MAETRPRLISLDEEVEGDRGATDDFVFCRIGEPVPLKPSNSEFDLQNPLRRPLAVSERFKVLFLANSEGFFVVKTKDAIGLAREIKEKGKGPCIKNSSLVEVNVGRVSILALSNDSSVLAATVGGDIHFFFVPSLLNKEHKPSFTCSLKKSGIVKDFRWQKNAQKSFLVLSMDGSLYHGHIKDNHKDVLENVDAVDWNVKGDLIAVARKNTISIFSSDFQEQYSMSLLFRSWSTDAESERYIKVDSIEWVRRDCIIVGCVRVNEDNNEEGYLLQAITIQEDNFSEPVVFSFPDIFEGILDDSLPTGAGPYLLSSYLERWGILLASNRKNIDQHILLLKYSTDDNKKEVLSLEFKSDKYKPTIALRENGDDNLVWGFGIDKVSVYEKVKIQVDLELKELSPYCVLFCLASDGRLFMYHVARISDPSDLPKSLHSSEMQLESDELLEASLRLKDDADGLVLDDIIEQSSSKSPPFDSGLELKKSEKKDTNKAVGASTIPTKEYESSETAIAKALTRETATAIQSCRDAYNEQGSGSSERKSSMQENAFSTKSSEITISFSGGFSNQESVRNLLTAASIPSSGNAGNNVNQTTVTNIWSSGNAGKNVLSHKVAPGTKGNFDVGSESKPAFSSQKSHATDLLSGSNAVNSGVSTNPSSASYSSTNTAYFERHASFSASKKNVSVGKSLFTKQQLMDTGKVSSTPQTFDSEPEIVKQVKEMMRDLDTLLFHIQREGGFKDACTVSLQGSLLALEEGLNHTSRASKIHKSEVEEELAEIQELQSKMLQVSAKQVYMEGILRQASDSQYWDIWNRQKLSPEFEQKRQLILKANQELTNKLVELEKYFNAVEISRFGESSRVSTYQRVFHGNMGQSRRIQSIHSVFNTLNSQLAAAGQLSECLSKQVAALNINSPSSKRDAITRELFESIGISDGDCSFKSPDIKGPRNVTGSVDRYCSSTVTASKDHNMRITSSALQSSEPESTRRRKDSLDISWAGFEPQKTIVKRTTQPDHRSISVNKPFRTAKQAFDSQIELFSNIQPKATESHSSLADSLMKKAHSEVYTLNKGIEEKTTKQAFDSQSSSALKWAKELPNSYQILNSELCPDHLQKNMHKSAMDATQYTQGKFGSLDTGSNTTATVTTMPGTQLEFPISTFSPIKLSREVPLVNGSWASEPKSLVSKQQDLRDLQAVKLQGSIKNAVSSPQNLPAMSSESNLPLVFSIPVVPSSDSNASIADSGITKCKDQANSSSASALSSRIEFAPSVFSSPSSAPIPMASVPTVSLSSTTSSPVSAVGGSSLLDAKNVGELKLTRAALPASVASAQSLSLNVQSLTGSLATTGGLSFPHLNDAKLVAEAMPQALVDKNAASIKAEPAISPLPKTGTLFGSSSQKESSLISGSSSLQAAFSNSQAEIPINVCGANTMPMGSKGLYDNVSQEDEMEEEAPDNTNVLNLGNLGGFGLGSQPPSSAAKTNPFGGTFVTANTNNTSSPITLTTSPGQFFRPPSFSLPSAQPMQPSQSITPNAFSGGSPGGLSGFGQPAQVGAGQQVLGSVLGTFGQSRQLGAGGFGVPSAASGGGFASGVFTGAATGGGFTSFAARPSGFAGAATGGGFASPASGGGGFANAAAGGGFGASSSGGFASAATGGGFGASGSSSFAAGGGFASVASRSGGFAAAAPQGAGFGGSTAGGFGAFSGNQGSAFSVFGGNSTTGSARPPAELFTQMRK